MRIFAASDGYSEFRVPSFEFQVQPAAGAVAAPPIWTWHQSCTALAARLWKLQPAGGVACDGTAIGVAKPLRFAESLGGFRGLAVLLVKDGQFSPSIGEIRVVLYGFFKCRDGFRVLTGLHRKTSARVGFGDIFGDIA